MSDNIVHTTDGGFDQDVLNSEKPVLVDYWAEWCGPCKMIAPILEEVAGEYADKLKVCKKCCPEVSLFFRVSFERRGFRNGVVFSRVHFGRCSTAI